MKNKIDDQELYCPYCGEIQEDAGDLNDSENITICNFCGKTFECQIIVELHYKSNKILGD